MTILFFRRWVLNGLTGLLLSCHWLLAAGLCRNRWKRDTWGHQHYKATWIYIIHHHSITFSIQNLWTLWTWLIRRVDPERIIRWPNDARFGPWILYRFHMFHYGKLPESTILKSSPCWLDAINHPQMTASGGWICLNKPKRGQDVLPQLANAHFLPLPVQTASDRSHWSLA